LVGTVFVIAVLSLASAGVLAQTSMQTILTNGPASNRFNIVFLSEGYTSAQLSQFASDATNGLTAFLAHQPYREYSNYFNAFAIRVASTDSGSDHPVNNSYVNTYFNSSYDAVSDYLITIPPNAFDANSSHGQGKVDALLQTNMPKCNLSVLLVNDTTHQGGSDGFDKTAIAAMEPVSMPEILTHETGHVMAGLGDEYTFANPGFPNTEEPNTTVETNRAGIKWKAWIAPATPVPTPPTSDYGSVVGLFQGAHYHTNGWYRPKLNCLMSTLYSPFCDVCSEALVLALYQKVRPVDAFSPATNTFSVTTTQAVSFSLSLLRPATHNLTVQWSTNGVAVPAATNQSFSVLPLALGNPGARQVSALIVDPTTLVRNDPTNLLRQTVNWTVNLNVPQLRWDSIVRLAGGKIAYRLTGNAPQGFSIQSSTNLSYWSPFVISNSLSSGQFWITNPTTATRTFFRGKTPP
jgi:hypothetical protein